MKIRLVITIQQFNISFKLVSKKSFGIWSSSSIHSIKYKFKIFPQKKFRDNREIKLLFHQIDIMSNILNNLNPENRFISSLNIFKCIISNFIYINFGSKVEICNTIFFDDLCLFVDYIGELLLSWSTISRIELNSKIFFGSSRIVACS